MTPTYVGSSVRLVGVQVFADGTEVSGDTSRGTFGGTASTFPFCAVLIPVAATVELGIPTAFPRYAIGGTAGQAGRGVGGFFG